MKLYHSQFTRSGRARWMLEELGVPYEIERVALMKGEGRTPAYKAIHPHGAVPSLVEGDLKLIESSAILMHLADKFADKALAPPLGSDARAEYYRWLVYVPATVDPVLEAITQHTRLLPEDRRVPQVAESAQKRLASIGSVLASAVEGKPYIVGDAFTAADVAVASAAGWMGFIDALGEHPALAAYHARMSERPAYVRAYAD